MNGRVLQIRTFNYGCLAPDGPKGSVYWHADPFRIHQQPSFWRIRERILLSPQASPACVRHSPQEQLVTQ